MKSSLILLSGASLALAGPVAPRDAVVVYDVVTEVVTQLTYYTVTAEAPTEPSSSSSIPVVVVTVTADTYPTPSPPPPAAEPATTSSSSTPVAQVQVAAAATPAAGSFEQIALEVHNAHRANNSAADLTYDDTYAGYAATLAARCTFEHDV